MATPGEKKALLFLSLVAVLGSAARLVAAYQVPAPNRADRDALERQLRIVDSVRRDGGRRKQSEGRGRTRQVRAKRSTDSTPAAGLQFPPPTSLSPQVAPQLAPNLAPLDVDRATAAQLEALPGIGPALARRIVAARDSSGPFGTLDELQTRVRGVGPALAKRLAPAVTFSGPRSPPSAERTQPFGNGGTTGRAGRRRGL